MQNRSLFSEKCRKNNKKEFFNKKVQKNLDDIKKSPTFVPAKANHLLVHKIPE